MRNAFRDFFRRIRVGRHVRANGDLYSYRGLEVECPLSAGLGVCNALMRGKYERDEADMILAHLPAHLPVIELGGSLGVVSRVIRSRLDAGTRHLVVEANPRIVETCRKNATRDAEEGATDVVNAALYYGAAKASFTLGPDVHSNALSGVGRRGEEIEVDTVSLSALHQRLGAPERFALVSDIEGGEYQIVRHEPEMLAKVEIAIVEIHPAAFAADGGSEAAFLAAFHERGLVEIDRRGDVVVMSRAGAA